MPWLLDCLDLPRYGSESKKRYTPRLVPSVDYGFDQWSIVSFCYQETFYIFFYGETVYTHTYLYRCSSCKYFFTFYGLAINLQIFFLFPNFLLTLHTT